MIGNPFGKTPATPAPDPYSLVPPFLNVVGGATCATFPDWDNVNGRVPVDVKSLTGTTLTLIIAGQSLSTNCCDGTYTPTNLGALNFSITNGGLYRAKDPLLGCTGFHPNLPGAPWPTGHWGIRLADKLINAGKATNVILVPIGVGGSNIFDWQVGGGNNSRITVTAARLAKAGIAATAFLWEQGESNNNGTTQLQYFTAGSSMLGTVQAAFPGMPSFVATASWINGTTSAAVQAAQAQLVSHPLVWAGPNCDARGNTFRQSDQTHWNNATGSDANAGDWQTALGLYGAPF